MIKKNLVLLLTLLILTACGKVTKETGSFGGSTSGGGSGIQPPIATNYDPEQWLVENLAFSHDREKEITDLASGLDTFIFFVTPNSVIPLSTTVNWTNSSDQQLRWTVQSGGGYFTATNNVTTNWVLPATAGGPYQPGLFLSNGGSSDQSYTYAFCVRNMTDTTPPSLPTGVTWSVNYNDKITDDYTGWQCYRISVSWNAVTDPDLLGYIFSTNANIGTASMMSYKYNSIIKDNHFSFYAPISQVTNSVVSAVLGSVDKSGNQAIAPTCSMLFSAHSESTSEIVEVYGWLVPEFINSTSALIGVVVSGTQAPTQADLYVDNIYTQSLSPTAAPFGSSHFTFTPTYFYALNLSGVNLTSGQHTIEVRAALAGKTHSYITTVKRFTSMPADANDFQVRLNFNGWQSGHSLISLFNVFNKQVDMTIDAKYSQLNSVYLTAFSVSKNGVVLHAEPGMLYPPIFYSISVPYGQENNYLGDYEIIVTDNLGVVSKITKTLSAVSTGSVYNLSVPLVIQHGQSTKITWSSSATNVSGYTLNFDNSSSGQWISFSTNTASDRQITIPSGALPPGTYRVGMYVDFISPAAGDSSQDEYFVPQTVTVY